MRKTVVDRPTEFAMDGPGAEAVEELAKILPTETFWRESMISDEKVLVVRAKRDMNTWSSGELRTWDFILSMSGPGRAKIDLGDFLVYWHGDSRVPLILAALTARLSPNR